MEFQIRYVSENGRKSNAAKIKSKCFLHLLSTGKESIGHDSERARYMNYELIFEQELFRPGRKLRAERVRGQKQNSKFNKACTMKNLRMIANSSKSS